MWSLSQTVKRTEDTERTSKQVTISDGQIEDTRENEAQIRGHCHRTVEQTENTQRISKRGHCQRTVQQTEDTKNLKARALTQTVQ